MRAAARACCSSDRRAPPASHIPLHCVATTPQARAVVASIGREIRGAMQTRSWAEGGRAARAAAVGGGADGGGGRRCTDSALQTISHEIVPANSMLFTGPIHLNAKASGLLACAVHEQLSRQCGTNVCASGDGRRNNATAAAVRHRAFCNPLRRALGVLGSTPEEGQRFDQRYWDTVQASLHPPRGGVKRP